MGKSWFMQELPGLKPDCFDPGCIYFFKVNNRSLKTRCETCSKLTIKAPERRQWPVASFWCLYCQLWTYFTFCSSVPIVKFEKVNSDWVFLKKQCLTKKVLKTFFSLKFLTNLFSLERGGMIGIFSLFKKRLSNKQLVLELFSTLHSLFATLV